MSTVKSPKPRRFSRIAPDNDDSASFFTSSEHLPNESAIESSASSIHLDVETPKSSYIPPWTEPYIIGVAGNSGSGKTSISQKIIQELNQPWTILLSFDNFYNPLNEEERKQAFNNNFDFDTPESLDLDLLVETVKSLKSGEKTQIPVYSFQHHNRTSKSTTIYGANVIIIEGIYALYDQRLLDLMDLKIYVDTDLDICLSRRLTRDILYRGRDLAGAIKQWETFVKPNAVKYVNPTMNNADLVIPRGLDNSIAINLMIKHIQKQLALKSSQHLKYLKELGVNIDFDIAKFNIKILPTNNQTRGINSILFDVSTERSDFIFYFNRISVLIIETALEFITNYKPVRINHNYDGLRLMDEIMAVNIIRSGDCFMSSIKKTFPEISIGKLLIQSDSRTGEPQLHFDSLSSEMARGKKILLFDSQIISGAASIMAIQVLIDHKVAESDIILCSYLSTEIGLRRIVNVFPKVNVVVGKMSSIEIGEGKWYNEENFKDSDWHFRNRFIDSLYFGTD
ncbi:uridine kinase [Scheffersomyces xylosifermentans]|uniref:uridine kinase n=1 Tax=Scheffersomyces xylosifermentans TaxID=1304137 RepID=UPI00315D3835